MKKFFFTLTLTACTLGCAGQSFPYLDSTLSADERARDLLSRLTLEQKVSLMMNDSPAIPELGIHGFNWWSEALHGAARSGLATVFPQAIGMAASFDDALLEQVFDAASTEQRIKYIEARKANNVKRYSGLAVWTPNINIFRDPRWGRGQETYGEDPYLTMRMGRAVVLGLQGEASHPYVYKASPYNKLHACLKHYAIHSGPEYERHVFNAIDLSNRDLQETYLYAFERLVKTTDVKEVMCAYNAWNGEPCCGSDNLLNQILRNEWGYQGLVVSDCGAIRDFYDGRPGFHNIAPNAAVASANAVLSGTDINCGNSYQHLPEAVKNGAIREADLDVSVLRLLKARFEMGDMDRLEADPWNSIDPKELCSQHNQQLAHQMALETMTLLQNRNQVLPLDPQRYLKIAVLGPNANDSLTLWGNYNGQPARSTTVLDGLKEKVGADRIIYRKVSEWVAREEFLSQYNLCQWKGERGMLATYWNNTKQSGTPVAEQQLSAPFHFCTLGATVFAPGVALTDFSARYESDFTPTKSAEMVTDLYVCGQGNLTVLSGNDTVMQQAFKTGHGPRRYVKEFKAQTGKTYHIVLNFAYLIPDAQLNFDLGTKQATDLEQVLADTRDADVYVYVGGISPQLEGEEMKVDFEGFKGGDRTDIELPKVQRETLAALHKSGKPVVFVNMSGSALGLTPEVESCDAILQAWYGGQAGGLAVAEVLLGEYNPAGRLPVTFYANVNQLPDYHDYQLKGHTYRYFEGEPVFAFGQGLSYSTFSYGQAKLYNAASAQALSAQTLEAPSVGSFAVNDSLVLVVPVTNTSKRDGDEVVQLYIKKDDDVNGPKYALRGFKRQLIPAGQTALVQIPLTEFNFRTYNDESGRMQTTPGTYTLYYGSSSRLEDLHKMTVICSE